jgi:hypothetical protein
MMTNLKRKKKKELLFKTKTQPANSNNDQGGDERHNIEVNRRMHSGDAKIADLVRKHLQSKEKTRIGRERVKEGRSGE